MRKTLCRYFVFPLLLLLSKSSGDSAPPSAGKSPEGGTGTLERMIVANGRVALDLDLSRLSGIDFATKESTLETLRFQVGPDSFFTVLLFNDVLRGPELGSMGLVPQNTATLPGPLQSALNQLAIEKLSPDASFDLAVRDRKTGFVFFNIQGNLYEYDAAVRSLSVTGGRLLISEAFANSLGRPANAGMVVGTISIVTTVYPIETMTIAQGEARSSTLPPLPRVGRQDVPNLVAGPDVIVGDLPSTEQFGSNSTQVGVAVGTTSCNNGTVAVNWSAMPKRDHPVVPQNMYRMSGGATNDERFEQIGQSWMKHTFGVAEDDVCGFGCTPGGAGLGPGCSDPYLASFNAGQGSLGSRAWVNPFTGIFPSIARDHTGHGDSSTAPTHRVLIEMTDLNTTLNPGAIYFAEAQYVTPHEYAWCQAHPGECNMYNNVSYRQFNVSGTTSFTFSPAGATVPMTPAINAWPGATINMIEPAPGIDGRGFIAWKVTGPVAGVWHYEYALYNQNLDRSIQSFTVPLGCGITLTNVGFHAPPNHPGIAHDGTQNNAGYSNAAWTPNQTTGAMTWSTETFAQNQNANAIRWGTLYNFRFDSDRPPLLTNATIGYFKNGAPTNVVIQAPNACNAAPTPIPTPTPVVTPTPTPGATPSPTPAPSPSGTPSPTPCGTFSSTAAINVTDFGTASPYPSNITVTALSGTITKVTVRLINLSHTFPADIDVLLVGPGGQNAIIMSDVGGSDAVSGVTLLLDDAASNSLPGAQLTSGTFKPTNLLFGDTWPAPAPSPSGSLLSVFNGTLATGTWSLYVLDDAVVDQGGIAGGWELSLTTTNGTCPTPTPRAQAVNLSTRMRIQSGDNVGIGGFIITGTAPKHVLLRALGPSLTQFGVPNVLADPVLELHGPAPFATVNNDNWRDDPAQQAAILATGIAPTDNFEAAIDATLNPGAYTAVVRGKNDTSGVGLIEVYDLSQSVPAKLANISTRAFVSTGDGIVIAGFVLGNSPGIDTIIVRGIGPSLTAFGLTNALANPTLELRNNNGALLIANNDWQDNPAQMAELMGAGLAPGNPLESAIAATLPPGAYTALLAGLNSGTGIGLVEVYDRGP